MFESEDFDLDEDFLKDIGEKEEEYYSQKNETHIERDQPSKRRKTEPQNFDLLNDLTFDDEPDFAKNTRKSIESSPKTVENTNLISRKQKILDIFKTSSSIVAPNENIPKILNSAEKSTKNSSISLKNKFDENLELSRKNLALEILRKGSASAVKKSQIEEKNEKFPHPLRQLSSVDERNSQIRNCTEQIDRKRVLEEFKKPRAKLPKSPAKFGPKTLQKFSSHDRSIAAPRMTVVRKFPGPAGLLPDSPDTNLDHANFLNRLDENKIEINDDNDDSNVSDYCSQNTERLFSIGAWRTMLDDLPSDFLKGHEIGTIKSIARIKSSRGNTRVPFLAGLIQRIDHSLENPRIELKDLSDSIEGTMHGDILIAHPNIFEPGVVIFLRNAGLLRIQGSHKFPVIQFHVMIAPKNVLAVYTEKSRIIISPLMESIIGTANRLEKVSLRSPSGKSPKKFSKIETNGKEMEGEDNSAMLDNVVEMNDFEDDDDDDIEFACFNIAEIVDSEVETKFSNLPPNVGSKMVDVSAGNESTARGIPEKMPLDRYVRNENSARNEKIEDRKEKSVEETGNEIRPKKISPVRSRLLQFRSKDVLTPVIREEMMIGKSSPDTKDVEIPREDPEEEKESDSRGFGEDLLNSDNDTEDEILSQLDVDSIVTSYNSAN